MTANSETGNSGELNVFVSFDTEHDTELYELLLSQSESPNSGFSVSGGSERLTDSDVWNERVRRRVSAADEVIVICGEHTEESMGMCAELRIVQEEKTPYFLLWGRREMMCTKPMGAKPAEGMYSWTRQILQDRVSHSLRKARSNATAETLRNSTRKGGSTPPSDPA